jgi:hypothetical protein
MTGQGSPYQRGVRVLRFGSTQVASDGTSIVYHVISYGGGGEIAGEARCIIPHSDDALRMVDRIFHVTASIRTPAPQLQVRSLASGLSTALRLDVMLDAVTATACRYGGVYPDCNYAPSWSGDTDVECRAEDPYCGGGGSSGDGWAWGGAGDSSSDPPTPNDGTGRPACTRDADGECITRTVQSPEFDFIQSKIASMKDSPQECADAKRFAQELVAMGSGRFKVWDGYDVYADPASPTGFSQRYGYNDADPYGRILVFDAYWLQHMPDLVAHEALHNYLARINSPLTGDQNEAWVRQWADVCA